MNTINEMQKFDYNSFYSSRNGVSKGLQAKVSEPLNKAPSKVEVAHPAEGKRGNAKYSFGKKVGIFSGQDPKIEAKAEEYLKKNSIDAYVIGNTNGMGKTYIAVKDPNAFDKLKGYGSNSKYSEILWKATELAGGQGWPSVIKGFTDNKKIKLDAAAAQKAFADKDKIIIHKKNGTTFAIKNDGRTVAEQLEEYIEAGYITEDEVEDSMNLISESFFNY